MAHPGGRPKKYTPEFLKQLAVRLNLFVSRQRLQAQPIFLQQFGYENNIDASQLSQFCDKNNDCYDEEFSKAYIIAKRVQEYDLAQGALCGRYDAGFAFRTLKNVAGWRDEQHLKSEHTERKVILVRNERALNNELSRSDKCLS